VKASFLFRTSLTDNWLGILPIPRQGKRSLPCFVAVLATIIYLNRAFTVLHDLKNLYLIGIAIMRLHNLLFVHALSILVSSATTGIPIARARAADQRHVDVLIGQDASNLEQFAAQQLCYYLKEIYDVTSEPLFEPRLDAHIKLIVGRPTTNSTVARALAGTSWPEMSEQGIVLIPVQLDDKPALIIGGGSDRATLWAVYELVERWGVRFLLDGDVFPDDRGGDTSDCVDI